MQVLYNPFDSYAAGVLKVYLKSLIRMSSDRSPQLAFHPYMLRHGVIEQCLHPMMLKLT